VTSFCTFFYVSGSAHTGGGRRYCGFLKIRPNPKSQAYSPHRSSAPEVVCKISGRQEGFLCLCRAVAHFLRFCQRRSMHGLRAADGKGGGRTWRAARARAVCPCWLRSSKFKKPALSSRSCCSSGSRLRAAASMSGVHPVVPPPPSVVCTQLPAAGSRLTAQSHRPSSQSHRPHLPLSLTRYRMLSHAIAYPVHPKPGTASMRGTALRQPLRQPPPDCLIKSREEGVKRREAARRDEALNPRVSRQEDRACAPGGQGDEGPRIA